LRPKGGFELESIGCGGCHGGKSIALAAELQRKKSQNPSRGPLPHEPQKQWPLEITKNLQKSILQLFGDGVVYLSKRVSV
jgi:hypothetical protein